MTAQLTGDKELIRKLNQLGTKGAKKATRAGIRAAMTPVVKAARAGVNATTTASPAVKRAARKAIGKRFVAKKAEAKVGFGVGKPAKKKRMAAHERNVYGEGGARLVRGVGISASNIHWFILGTKERATKTPARATGRIKSVLSDVIPNATMQSAGASVEAARQKIQQVIEREAQKRA